MSSKTTVSVKPKKMYMKLTSKAVKFELFA